MIIFPLTTAVPTKYNPWALSDLQRLERIAKSYSSQDHRITTDPKEADVILFCGSGSIYHSDIIRSDWFSNYIDKLMILDTSDSTIPLIPGLYASLQSDFPYAGRFYGGYPYIRVIENASLANLAPMTGSEPYLYSFVGNMLNAPHVRGAILALKDDRALLKDSSSGQKDGFADYASTLEQSFFILCPKGLCSSSWRIYEAMKAGRIPVVISDQWVPPKGFMWESFSIRIPEAEVCNLPDILRSYEHLVFEMGAQAKHEFESHLGLDTAFGWICDNLKNIKSHMNKGYDQCYRSRLVYALSANEHRRSFAKEKIRDLINSILRVVK